MDAEIPAFYEQNTREYAEWQSILDSGVPVHPPWRNFKQFLKDTGRCGRYGYRLARIDSELAYRPGNVTWVCVEQGFVVVEVKPGKRRKRALVSDLPLQVLAKAAAEVLNRSALELKLFAARNTQRARALEDRCLKEGIDLSHWSGRHVRKPWAAVRKIRPLGVICATGVRRRVLREALIPYQCAKCRMPPEWDGAELTLHLDHINGDKFDHAIDNLQFSLPQLSPTNQDLGQQAQPTSARI